MFKTANVGKVDRIVRILLGVLLIALPYVYTSAMWSNPMVRWGIPLVGAVFILTALFRFCPLYRLIGTSTCKID